MDASLLRYGKATCFFVRSLSTADHIADQVSTAAERAMSHLDKFPQRW